FAKQNGAAAVCMRPLEGERHLSDPYFYPLYEAAVELDLAVAVHIANGNPENADLYRRAPAGRFAQFRVPTVTACFDVIMSELHAVFPGLRWGFIERRPSGCRGFSAKPRSATAPAAERFRKTFSRNTTFSSPARPTTTCLTSCATAVKIAW